MSDIHQVAKEAGVSVATVSRVLNRHSSVSPKTRTRVEAVIEKLNYKPNMLGRNLRSSRSSLILALIPSTSNPYYTHIVTGIENEAITNNYNIMLCTTDSNEEREDMYFEMVKHKLVDGVISVDPSAPFHQKILTDARYPVVLCGEFEGNDMVPSVGIDNKTAAYRAVKHLISIGHRKIALINSNIHTASLREQGYLKALEEHNIPYNPAWVIHSDLVLQKTSQPIRELLLMKDRPTAVFAVSDTIAISTLKTIKDCGLSAPEDIAVVGFDNIEFSYMTNPSLTTISQPMKEMGEQAVRLLLHKIQSPKKKMKSIILDHELIIRESTMQLF